MDTGESRSLNEDQGSGSQSDETTPYGNHQPHANDAEVHFGNYILLERLGNDGAMGVVYKARQLRPDRVVALKRIISGKDATGEEIRRFITEVEAVAGLTHPNILPVYEFGEHDGELFYSMAFAEEGSLKERLARGPIPVKEAATLVMQVAHAVHHAHEHGIVHRDIKPANILLDNEGTPYIVDFGLAKRLDRADSPTDTGQWLGSPGYMPPEQAVEAREANEQSDIYSLGAVLYALVTGRPPFQAASILDTLMQVTTEEPASPRQLNASVPVDLQTVCMKCLHKDPQQRYRTAELLAADLERFLEGKPPTARPVSRATHVVRWSRRRPGVAALMVGVVVLSFGLVLGGVYAYRNNSQARRTAEEAQRKTQHTLVQAQKDRERAEAAEKDAASRNRQLESAQRELEKNIARREAAEERARRALRDAEKFLYVNDIHAAHDEWAKLRVGTAMARLQESPLKLENWEDIRGWEWYYLVGICRQNKRTFTGHSASVLAVDAGPEGRMIASADEEGNVCVWDVHGREVSHRFQVKSPEHVDDWNWVRKLAFSHDGKRLAAACDDGAARVWDLGRGNDEPMLFRHATVVMSVAFTTDGGRLASADQGGEFKIWSLDDPAAPSVERHVAESAINEVAFGFGDQYLAAAFEDGSAAVFSAYNGWLIREFTKHEGPVYAIDFFPGEEEPVRLITAGHDGRVFTWSVDEKADLPVEFQVGGEPVHAVEVRPQGAGWFASAGMDGKLRIWNEVSAEPLLEVAGHDGSLNDLAYAGGDGRTIVTAGEDTTVRVWDTSRSETMGILFKHSQPVRSLAFSGGVSDDRRLLASGGDDRVVRIWDLATCEEVLAFSRHGAPVTSVVFRPGTRHVLSCDRDGTALFWDATSGAPLLGPDFPAALAAEFSPDGAHLALACKSGEVRVLDLDGEEKGSKLTIPGATRPVFAPDGSYLAVIGRDGSVAVWDLKTGKLRCELNLDKAKAPVQLVIAPNGDRIWVATEDEGDFLLAFDPQTGAMLDQFGRDGPVDHMTLTPGGSRILTSDPDGRIRLWFIETGDAILTLRPHGVPVTCVRFSPSGEMLACADRRGLIRLWIAPDASHLVQEDDGLKDAPPQ